MKILNLKFKNINSLLGENEIDFTQPSFTDEGLFAITGKTGAGKSSILDAISLALYGKTPRVEITSGENAVMTRGEKDCYSEIIFEVAGKKWKSSWKQERTRTGTLKQVERVVADENDVIIADKLSIKGERKNADDKTVNEKIVEILGLTFEQFTKAIMLAQGGFAAFLQADKNEKGELLEQITGTEIYAEISKKVFERKNVEAQKLERINIELEGITLLSEDEIVHLTKENSELSIEKNDLDEVLKTLESAKALLSDLENLRREIDRIKQVLPVLDEESNKAIKVFECAKNNLKTVKEEKEKQESVFIIARELDTKISVKAKLLQPILNAISLLENNKTILLSTIDGQQKKFEAFQKAFQEKQKWADEHKQYEELVSNYSVIEKESKQLEISLGEINKELETITELSQKLEEDTLKYKKISDDFKEKADDLREKQEELLSKNKTLHSTLGGKKLSEILQEKNTISDFGVELKNLIRIEKEILKNEKEIAKYTESISDFQTIFHTISETINRNREKEDPILHQIELLIETIQLTKTILSLEQHRHNLKDGEECPLCGALEHPFAIGNIPQLGEKEKELELLKKQHKELFQTIQEDEKKKSAIESSLKHAQSNKEKEEKSVLENRNAKADIEAKINAINSSFLFPEGDENKLEKLDEILNQKRENLRDINLIIEKAEDFEQSIALLRDSEIPRLKNETDAIEKEKTDVEIELRLVNQTLDSKQNLVTKNQETYQKEHALLSETFNRFGVATANDLKKCLESWTVNSKQMDEINNDMKLLDGKIALNTQEWKNLEKSIEEKSQEKEDLHSEQQVLLDRRKEIFGEKSVEEEERKMKTLLEKAENSKMETEQKKLDATTELEKSKAVFLTKETDFTKKTEQKNTDKTVAELETEIDEKKTKKDGFIHKIGAIEQQLEFNETQLKKNGEKLSEQATQKNISEKWNDLDKLIGSADGKKYRNFAQALTFEHLIGLSNQQLEKMSDRYILIRSEDRANPFELSVIDKFQNNEERTSKNLSGGEKFIISLSLALGLSTMASKNMRIDTMFIDEGFGTLDSEYLDLALSTLSNLQSEGKVIGVISHLTELKERIATHIEVVSGGNGHSRIQII